MINDPALREALTRCLSKGLTFAAFRRPGAPISLWVQRQPEVETVDGSLLWELNDVFLVAPFMLDPERIAMIRSDVDLSFGERGSDISAVFECIGAPLPKAAAVVDVDRETFTGSIGQARSHISGRALDKVVLSRTRTVPLDRAELSGLFLQACRERSHAFVALVHTPDHGTWLGATPERLLFAEEDHVRVDAIAGTMASDHAPSDPTAWGNKERAEQRFVVDSVLATFEQCGLSDVVAYPPETIGAGEVVHLRSRIEADLGGATLSDVVLALHPTPAVCGTPRDAALNSIRASEAHDRRLYTGFWGPWCPDGRTDLYVNIRCLLHTGENAVIFTGAGITEGSDPHKEWEETEQKAQTWLRPIEALMQAG